MKPADNTIIDIIALSQGSVKAFDTLFLVYYPRVKTFLCGMTGNAEVAEDLAQDTFVHLWSSRASLKTVKNLNAYIYQSTKHTLYDYWNRNRNIQIIGLEDAFATPSLDEVEDLVFSHELEELIDKAVDTMPDQRKRVFCMSRKQGMSNDEIANQLGISKRTVETHLTAALAMLRKIAESLKILLF